MSFRDRSKWRDILLTSICAWTICFLCVEGALRYFDCLDPPAFEDNSDYGYLMRPNQSVSTWGHRFQINNIGFRGPNIELEKPQNVFRIVFMGDSITFGGGRIADKDLFVSRVALSLNSDSQSRVEAINLAAPGWGIENMASYVAVKGVYEADYFIWVVSSDDFRRPKMTREFYVFWNVKPWSRFIYGASVIASKASVILTGVTGRRSAREAERLQKYAAETLQRNLEGFGSTLQRIKKSNIPCLVVVTTAADESEESLQDLERYRSISESFSIPFLNMAPVFEQHRPKTIFFDGVHLRVKGHKLVADAILAFLQKTSEVSADRAQ